MQKKKDVHQTQSTSMASRSANLSKKKPPKITSFVESKPALEKVEEEGETCEDKAADLLDLDFEMFSDTNSIDDEHPENDKGSLHYTMTKTRILVKALQLQTQTSLCS